MLRGDRPHCTIQSPRVQKGVTSTFNHGLLTRIRSPGSLSAQCAIFVHFVCGKRGRWPRTDRDSLHLFSLRHDHVQAAQRSTWIEWRFLLRWPPLGPDCSHSYANYKLIPLTVWYSHEEPTLISSPDLPAGELGSLEGPRWPSPSLKPNTTYIHLLMLASRLLLSLGFR